MDKLDEIMNWKRKEIASRIRPVRDSELENLAKMQSHATSLFDALSNAQGLGIISEIKRKSPSAGNIAEGINAVDQARNYVNAGTDAISVLTDEKYFAGTIQDLWDVTELLTVHQKSTPCLRKDFMVHPCQIVEAAEAGAKAILIIVRALQDDEIKALYDAANIANLDSIFEVHSEKEIERAVEHQSKIIGINNRDLARFKTDLGISERLLPYIPENIISISESGIHSEEDARRVEDAGADAVLVGESLMKAHDTEGFLQELKGI